MFDAKCSEDNAPTFAHWITNRGGIAVWSSANLSNPGASWSAPVRDAAGRVNGKPSWQAADNPVIVTDPAKVGVYREVLFKEIPFPVALRRGAQGMSLKLTEASQRKLDKALEQCKAKHGSAHFHKGGLIAPSMFVYYIDGEMVPLSEWKAKEVAA